jgi:AcrR family transcriptional regulator
MLDETDIIEKVTVRQIAERAGVSTCLINYHFQTKENLFSVAIGDVMLDIIRAFAANNVPGMTAVDKLRTMLKDLVDFGSNNQKMISFVLSREISENSMRTPLHLLPFLHEIYGNKKSDVQLRMMAMQILDPIQLAALNPVAFHMYSGMDLQNPEHRHRFVDLLIDNIVDPDSKR